MHIPDRLSRTGAETGDLAVTATPRPIRTGSGAWTALALLAAINFMNYYDRLLVVVVSEQLRLEFSLSDTQFGLLTGPAFVFVYAAASLMFGRIADIADRRRLIAFAVGLWSVMTALCGLARTFPMLALARAGIGVGEGGANPAGMSVLSDHFPPERRSTALALFQAGGMVGMLASFLLASQIAITFGWRAVFYIAALPGLVLAAAVLLKMPEPARGRFDRDAGKSPANFVKTLTDLWRNRAYRWLCAAASVGVYSSIGFLVWLPQFFIRYHGLDQSDVGLLFGPAATLGLITGMLLGGWLGDKLAVRSIARPVIICVGANVLLVPVMIVVLWAGSVAIALVACFVAMALAVVYAPSFQATMQSVCTPRQRGTAGAASNVLNALIGQGLAVLFVGKASDMLLPYAGPQSLRWALTISVAFTVIAGLAFIRAFYASKAHFSGKSSTGL